MVLVFRQPAHGDKNRLMEILAQPWMINGRLRVSNHFFRGDWVFNRCDAISGHTRRPKQILPNTLRYGNDTVQFGVFIAH